MKIRSIFLTSLIALTLAACTSPQNNPISKAEHDIVKIDDLKLKLTNHGKVEKNDVSSHDQKVLELYDKLEENQVIYMSEAEIRAKSLDYTIDFSATDTKGKEIRPAYISLTVDKSEIARVYFIIDEKTEIAKVNTIIEKDGVETTQSFIIKDPNPVTETNENKGQEAIDRIVLETLNPRPDIYISIHGSSTWGEDMLTENEISTLKSHLENPDNIVLILEYTIHDDRANKRLVDRNKSDYETDLISPYIMKKDGSKIESVYSRTLKTESDRETYNKDYFIVENTDDIEDIYFDLDINNEKLEPMGIDYGYDK